MFVFCFEIVFVVWFGRVVSGDLVVEFGGCVYKFIVC